MHITGIFLALALSSATFATTGAPRAPDAPCEEDLGGLERLRSLVEALPIADEATAYAEATMIVFDSPLMQSTVRDQRKITDPVALDLRGHGYAFEIEGGHLRLAYDGAPAAEWTFTQPIAEVRLHETADLRLEVALVGWVSSAYFELRGPGVRPLATPSPDLRVPPNWLPIDKWIAGILGIPFDERLAADRNSTYYADVVRAFDERDVRTSPWLPARLYRDPAEDFARMHELARRPAPPSYLRQALGQLAVETVRRARDICDRREMDGPILSAEYPNQLLGLAADRVRSNDDLLGGLARGINEGVDPSVRATVLPRMPEDPFADDGRELMKIEILGCSPLVFSIPPDPISGPRGWGVLTTHSSI